jgi:hypothetical protein
MARTSDRPAGDENAAAEVPVEVPENVPVASAQAAETGGPKMIRCYHGDVFVIDESTQVTGEWQEFNATAAKQVIEAARANGVRLAVAEKKG